MGTHNGTTTSLVGGLSVTLLAVSLLLAACGGDDTAATTTQPETATTTTATTSAPPNTTTTTVAPTTTAATTTTRTTTTNTTTTTTPGPSAADALADFFPAAAGLDLEISAAADVFNAGFDPEQGTLTDEARAAVVALRGKPGAAAELIPAGLSVDLETGVLAVFADLDSRVSALTGAEARLPQEPSDDVNIDYAMECLRNGSVSAARFADDLATARALAPTEPVPDAAPDSDEAGILAVRIETIRLMNVGCDACGGVQYDAPIPVDWEARTVMDGVEFTATFESGRWLIAIMAC